MVVSGGTINVMPGTAIGFREEFAPDAPWASWLEPWSYIGFDMWAGSTLVSHGTPDRPIVFTDVQTVQEASPGYMIANFNLNYLPNNENLPPPVLDFRFANFSLLASDAGYHFWGGYSEYLSAPFSRSSAVDLSLRDCSLRVGKLNIGKADRGIFASGAVNLENSLFERTKIYVDPNWLEIGIPSIYTDLSLQAHNNLFKNTLIRLVPATSGGSWVFKDNLFDKVAFEQATTQPLDHNFNAYWRRTLAELETWQTDRLTANAPDDRVLTAAPVYQVSALGEHYLATTSPLYNADKRGSRTPVDAGMYHYTTKVNQAKDGSLAGNIVIGRHYVATVSSTSTQPKDSDLPAPDGIPDYVENWHGDGDTGVNRIHTADETDWNNPASATDPTTRLPIPDASNVVYDNVDLDGDGLIGRVEAILGTNPLLSDNPLSLIEISGLSPNLRSFEVTANIAQSSQSQFKVLIDSHTVGLSGVTRTGPSTFRVDWNTLASPSGFHLLQLMLMPPPYESALPAGSRLPRILGPGLAVQNTAPLLYDYTSQVFGDQIRVAGVTSVPNGPYEVQIKDSTGTTLLKTIPGTTDAFGGFEQSWNLIPEGSSVPSTAESFQASMDLAFMTPSISVPLPNFLRSKTTHPARNDKFALAYGWHDTDHNNQRQAMVANNVRDILFTPAAGYPYLPTTLNSFNGTMFFLYAKDTDTPLLLNDLRDSGAENFFFIGHGAAGNFGAQRDDRKEPGLANISAGDVIVALGNEFIGKHGFTRLDHPYRLAIIDACESFDDMMCHAFGIEAVENAPLTFFQKDQKKPRAFVGWKVQIDLPKCAIGVCCFDDYGTSLLALFDAWMRDRPLKECLLSASGVHTWNLCPVVDKHYGIYGWPDLKRSGLNE